MASDPESSSATRNGRPAVFLDRDGTLIEDVGYLSDPKDIRIIPGVVEGLTRIGQAGFARVIVTNQSAVGRGMITPIELEQIHAEMSRLFEARGITFDAIYSCPEVPGGESECLIEHEDRKPGAGMLRRAALDLGLDLVAAWMIGDKLSDALAGSNAGCRSILLRTGKGAHNPSLTAGIAYPVVEDLPAAADLILSHDLPPGGPTGPPR